MKSLTAFFKKEMIEGMRGGKLLTLVLLFVAFGIMNPAIAKLTPWMLEMFSESLAETGMTITAVQVDALTSWTQFFKNIPMALIVFVLIYGGIFTKEYASGTLILMLTKGMARSSVVFAKTAYLMIVWTVGYYGCFAITYAYNNYYWDNNIAVGLLPAVLHWWLFGVWVICLLVLFSALMTSESSVLLAVGGVTIAVYLLGLIPKLKHAVPSALMNSAPLLVGAETADEYTIAVITAALMCVLAIATSIPLINQKQL